LAHLDRENLDGAEKVLRISTLAPEWQRSMEKRLEWAGIPLEKCVRPLTHPHTGGIPQTPIFQPILASRDPTATPSRL
jgi:hypothetical protein